MQQNLLIDYLVISFKILPDGEISAEKIMETIRFPLRDAERIRSYYGYPECHYYRGIKIHKSPDMVVLDMSGKGCRTCEELNPGWDWYRFLNSFDDALTVPIKDSDYERKGQFVAHISRIDLACDVLGDSRVTVPFLQNYVRKDKFICKSNYHTCLDGNKEMAIYLGSPRSDRRLRIYDKAMEQGLNDTAWVRYEFQLRDDNALSFYLNLSRTCGGDFAKCYYGMLHDYLRFLTAPNDDTNRVRKKTCPFG